MAGYIQSLLVISRIVIHVTKSSKCLKKCLGSTAFTRLVLVRVRCVYVVFIIIVFSISYLSSI